MLDILKELCLKSPPGHLVSVGNALHGLEESWAKNKRKDVEFDPALQVRESSVSSPEVQVKGLQEELTNVKQDRDTLGSRTLSAKNEVSSLRRMALSGMSQAGEAEQQTSETRLRELRSAESSTKVLYDLSYSGNVRIKAHAVHAGFSPTTLTNVRIPSLKGTNRLPRRDIHESGVSMITSYPTGTTDGGGERTGQTIHVRHQQRQTLDCEIADLAARLHLRRAQAADSIMATPGREGDTADGTKAKLSELRAVINYLIKENAIRDILWICGSNSGNRRKQTQIGHITRDLKIRFLRCTAYRAGREDPTTERVTQHPERSLRPSETVTLCFGSSILSVSGHKRSATGDRSATQQCGYVGGNEQGHREAITKNKPIFRQRMAALGAESTSLKSTLEEAQKASATIAQERDALKTSATTAESPTSSEPLAKELEWLRQEETAWEQALQKRTKRPVQARAPTLYSPDLKSSLADSDATEAKAAKDEWESEKADLVKNRDGAPLQAKVARAERGLRMSYAAVDKTTSELRSASSTASEELIKQHAEELRAHEERLVQKHCEELERQSEPPRSSAEDQKAAIDDVAVAAALAAKKAEQRTKHQTDIEKAVESGRLEGTILVLAQNEVKELELEEWRKASPDQASQHNYYHPHLRFQWRRPQLPAPRRPYYPVLSPTTIAAPARGGAPVPPTCKPSVPGPTASQPARGRGCPA
ncbi:hypothetical protein EI94DRAFT_1854558 [Lactarius quietus]|nr:hypothetical protein EI94DRAFT_1854558 [Lactarius quietus]